MFLKLISSPLAAALGGPWECGEGQLLSSLLPLLSMLPANAAPLEPEEEAWDLCRADRQGSEFQRPIKALLWPGVRPAVALSRLPGAGVDTRTRAGRPSTLDGPYQSLPQLGPSGCQALNDSLLQHRTSTENTHLRGDHSALCPAPRCSQIAENLFVKRNLVSLAVN